MNRRQKIVILIGALVLLAMGVFPPYLGESIPYGTNTAVKYAPIMNLPDRPFGYDWSLDLPRLAIQVVVLVVVVGAVVLFTGDTTDQR